MKILGIDIGGTQIKYGVVEASAVLECFQCDTPQGDYSLVLAKIIEITSDVLCQYADIDHIGVAVPGIVDIKNGVVRYANNLNWHNVRIGDDLSIATGKEVRVANDAHCATLGEALYGAGKECARVAMFTIGTGIGGGFVKDGKLETDLYGAMAYIFGHATIEFEGEPCNCGRAGCLEVYTSATAISKRIQASNRSNLSVKELFVAARNGDEFAVDVIDDFINKFSVGVANIANILRPHVVVIGGGVADSADLILPKVQDVLEREVYGYTFAPVKVAKAELGNTAGIIGAASL